MRIVLHIKSLLLLAFASGIFAATAARAHEDYPAEWCGGQDCRAAQDDEWRVGCGAVFIEHGDDSYGEKVVETIPIRSIPVWNGDATLICTHGASQRLNRCNPANGPCPDDYAARGFLVSEDGMADIKRRSRRVCRSQEDVASVLISGPTGGGGSTSGVGGGGGGGGSVGGGGGGGGGGGSNDPVTGIEIIGVGTPSTEEPEDDDGGEVLSTPVPASIAMMGLGIAMLVGRARLRPRRGRPAAA